MEHSDRDYHDHEVRERENASWIAYQKEGLAAAQIISREKQWANSSLRSKLKSWYACVFYSVCGGLLTVICAVVLWMLRDSSTARVLCGLGIAMGVGALWLFAKQATKKPQLHKTRAWLMAEEQLGIRN